MANNLSPEAVNASISYDDILDTIEVCQSYIDGYEAHKAEGRGDDFLFNSNSAKFAEDQIEFEKGRLADKGQA